MDSLRKVSEKYYMTFMIWNENRERDISHDDEE